MKKGSTWAGLAAVALLFAGCGGGEGAAVTGEAAAPAADPASGGDNGAWRSGRRAGLLEPDGWPSLVGLHWIELPAHYVGHGAHNGIRLAKGPGKMGLLQQQGGKV